MNTNEMATSPISTFYSTNINGVMWEVPERYQDLRPINSGGFGMVCSAIDTRYDVPVAIKKLFDPFKHHTIAKRCYRELKILQHLKHDNCLCLLDVFTPSERYDSFTCMYLVTPLMTTDLGRVLKEQKASNKRILGEEHVKHLMYQLLCGLKYVHSANIIHRDLKPDNLSINLNCDLRILDFGLARTVDDDMTGYVATRYWRAPEIMLQWRHYDKKVDLWSVGCIMAELFTGSTLFPAPNQLEHLKTVFKVVGTPDEELLEKIDSKKTALYLQSLMEVKRKDIGNLLGILDPEAVNLLENLLVLDPDRRYDVEQALSHSYFNDCREKDFEVCGPKYDDKNEKLDMDCEGWRELIWKEIKDFESDPRLYSALFEED